ncbi:MAG: hypothetical protein L0G25_09310 [Psychrobacter sp.]|nr:hypothetical protein [Psychrobacter sp.]
MDNSKQPLPDEMNEIASHKSTDMNRDDQLIDLDNDMLHTIDNDEVIDNAVGFNNSEAGSGAIQGLTPVHRQNIDESRIDELLVEENLNKAKYPDIVAIADEDAAQVSNGDDL